jgi:hypothetical protein
MAMAAVLPIFKNESAPFYQMQSDSQPNCAYQQGNCKTNAKYQHRSLQGLLDISI